MGSVSPKVQFPSYTAIFQSQGICSFCSVSGNSDIGQSLDASLRDKDYLFSPFVWWRRDVDV